MKSNTIALWISLLFATSTAPVVEGELRSSGGQGLGIQGYAGPGWSVLFGSGGMAETASLGPIMFRISETLYLGPMIAYEESSSEGPGSFLGGAKLEVYLPRLSRGFFSTSAGISVLAGAVDLNEGVQFAAQVDAELGANLLLFPSFCLAAGPMLSFRLRPAGATVLPGFGFSLKEGRPDNGRPLFNWRADGPRIGGYWQGLWTFVNGEAVFVDGGGTRLELPMGLAFGITGGVLRQKVQQSGSDLAIMLTGVTTEWNWHISRWLTVTPRVMAGLGMYGWAAADGSLDGGPHFVLRPELCAYLGILPFMEVGGGVGYQFVPGAPATAIPLDPLSSLALSVQVRVGHR